MVAVGRQHRLDSAVPRRVVVLFLRWVLGAALGSTESSQGMAQVFGIGAQTEASKTGFLRIRYPQVSEISRGLCRTGDDDGAKANHPRHTDMTRPTAGTIYPEHPVSKRFSPRLAN
jgi:hypothetical protein